MEEQKTPEFEYEQKHLDETYDKLLEMKEELQLQIMALNANAASEKNDIRDNLRLDFADDETKMEMLGEIEAWNRYIDGYNVASDSMTNKLGRVKTLLKAPYFARITLQFDPDEEPEDFYIGSASVAENDYDQIVTDWRSPIAETYYNQENGKTSYEVEGKRIPVDLKLRRQFDLTQNKLNAFFDTQVAIEDPMLLHTLSKQRTGKMQAITATIQKEQNAVIRHADVPVLLVNGIAGSGKTSVLLQRIAYLFYRQRKTLRPDQVYLMTLNPVFRQYIDNVLPDLGETNPNTLTWIEFMDSCSVPFRDSDYGKTTAESLKKIDELLPTLTPKPEYFLSINQKENKILSAKEILEVINEYPKLPMGERLIQVVMDELEERTRQLLRKKEMNLAKENSDLDDRQAAKELRREDENRLQNDFGGAIKSIHKCTWVNIEKIGTDILGKKKLTAIEWLYLKMALTGMCERNARYVMVDEVQDYTMAQMMVLERYFPNARFMLLGDEFQAIREGTVKFSDIHDFFDGKKKSVLEVSLMTSYRSSPEITDLFTKQLPKDLRIQTSSVQRPGQMPVIEVCKDRETYGKKLREAIASYGGSGHVNRTTKNEDIDPNTERMHRDSETGLTAIVCEDHKTLQRVADMLGEDAPLILKPQETMPQSGMVLMLLQLAKGLEFDNVIIPDAEPDVYGEDELSKHRLYTALSRATQKVTVLAYKELTGLLQ